MLIDGFKQSTQISLVSYQMAVGSLTVGPWGQSKGFKRFKHLHSINIRISYQDPYLPKIMHENGNQLI